MSPAANESISLRQMTMLGRIHKFAYRKIRYHWMTERIQYELRRHPTLKLSENRGMANHFEMTVNPGDVIIDCGANIGDVTSLFARAGATVYAFEPNPLCFSILSRRFSGLRLVHCFNQGVMDRDCKMTLSTPNPHERWDAIETTIVSSFIQGAMHTDKYTVQEAEIECIDIDRFIRSLNRRVRLLKLDIEGAEIAVINRLIDAGSIDLVDLIAAETHEHVITHLKDSTDALCRRIEHLGLESKIRLDWN
jgi:FkbM family methyltransferase